MDSHALGPRAQIRVLEMGFGTGLNALLTRLRARRLEQLIDFVSVESQPLPQSIISQLNYGRTVEGATEDMLAQLHAAPWGEVVQLEPFFRLQKVQARIEEVELVRSFNAVYYDAFGPAYQPELWTSDLFARIRRSSAGRSLGDVLCERAGQARPARGGLSRRIPAGPSG